MAINKFKLIASVAICELAGIIGSIFTSSSIATWYVQLNRPSIAPPNWIFAPVWTTLFLLMGVALYLVWEKGTNRKGVRSALTVFGVQLFLNIIWSALFFGLRNPFYALLELIILWLAIILTTAKFYRVSKPAAYLMIPYIIWVSFAAVLNYLFVVLNQP